MKRFFTLAFSLATALGGLTFTPAFADGVVNAVSYQPLSRTAAISVEPLDDSEESNQMTEEFAAALKAKGFRIVAPTESDLVFTFSTSSLIGSWSKGERRTILEIDKTGGKNDEDGPDNRVMLNIFDSSRGALLNQGTGDPKTATHPARYRVDVTLDDRKAKQRLWQAWAVADVERGDSYTLNQSMINVLSGIVGTTVRRQEFSVP